MRALLRKTTWSNMERKLFLYVQIVRKFFYFRKIWDETYFFFLWKPILIKFSMVRILRSDINTSYLVLTSCSSLVLTKKKNTLDQTNTTCLFFHLFSQFPFKRQLKYFNKIMITSLRGFNFVLVFLLSLSLIFYFWKLF